MRISCVAIGRVVDPQGRYLLFTDQRRAELGTRTLMPIGLPLTTKRRGMEHLIRHFHADAFEEPGQREMRFRVPDAQVPALQEWFNLRTLRNVPDLRSELQRRLAVTGVLRRSDLKGITQVFCGTNSVKADSTRLYLTDRCTTYLTDVFDLVLPAGAWQRIVHATVTLDGNSPVWLLHQEEFNPGRHRGTHFVNPICQALLPAKQG